jgi:hypothetical protein
MNYLAGSFLDESSEILKILNIKKLEDFKIHDYSSSIDQLFFELGIDDINYSLPLWGHGPNGSIIKKNEKIISKSIQTRYDTNIKNIVFNIKNLFSTNNILLTKEVDNELKIIELLTLSISIESYINFCLQKIENDWYLFEKEESFHNFYKNYKMKTCIKSKNEKCIEYKYSKIGTDLLFVVDLVSSKNFCSEEKFKDVLDLIKFRNEIVHIKNRKIED